MWNLHDALDALIVAPATPQAAGGRGIVRISGEGLDRLLAAVFEPVAPARFGSHGEPAKLVAARLAAPLALEWGALEVEILHWPGPSGPTAGPLAELQLPASAPLVEAIIAECCRRGARLARGGEFSLRAFLAGRLDLLQAEAVLAVVDARTPGELAAALDRMAGGVGGQLAAVREMLLDLVADIEAAIDFADETAPDSLPVQRGVFWGNVDLRLGSASAAIEQVTARLASRDGGLEGRLPRAVLVGRPNIGKSSLFNAVLGRDAALVADEVGTTRDWIAARLEGEGVACMLVDLAGIDAEGPAAGTAAADAVGRLAASAAVAELAAADIVIVCRDAAEPASAPLEPPPGKPVIEVVTRCDRVGGGRSTRASAAGTITTSTVGPTGIDAVRRAILRAAAALPGQSSAATLRMRVGIDAASAAIEAARGIAAAARAGADQDEAVVAGFLNRAISAIGEVTGIEIGNDIIDRVFSRHCIGK
jgi:tRNA modification GTPase